MRQIIAAIVLSIPALVAAMLILSLAVSVSEARERWYQVVSVDSAKLTVEQHTLSKHEFIATESSLLGQAKTGTAAFSMLYRSKHSDGSISWHCDIYLSPIATRLDLEHEFRHCDGWDH